MHTVMIVAGSDSGGGAGIQADIKSVSALGCFPTTAITALTAQNTQGVRSVFSVSPAFVLEQMEAILEDIGADAVKTGMLFSQEIILAVADRLKTLTNIPLVVDPVMISTSGHSLLQPEAEDSLKRELIPLATVLTPNMDETARLAGFPVTCEEDMERAADQLLALGPQWILVKGGHLQGEAKDLLARKGDRQWFCGKRVESRNTHGTGCTLASAIAAGLAKGLSVPEAVGDAKRVVTFGIEKAPGIGKGHGPLDPLALMRSHRGR